MNAINMCFQIILEKLWIEKNIEYYIWNILS